VAERNLRYGLIGAGTMGREHLRNLALIPGSPVTAIADPDAGSQRQSLEAAGNAPAIFADTAALLNAGLCDALVVASPNDTHRRVLEEVFAHRSKLPVLVEKPLCTTAEDCRWLASATKSHPAPVWVGMEYRYMPAMQRFRQEVQAGSAGTLRMLAIREHRNPFLVKVGDWNRFARRTGGTLVEKCCHFFDLMRLIVGDEPVRIYASGAMDVNHIDERYAGEKPDIIDNAFVVVDFRNGVRAMLDLSMFAEGAKWEAEYAATGDIARIDCLIPPFRAYDDGAQAEIHISPRQGERRRVPIEVDPAALAAGHHSGATYYEHVAFRRAILEGALVEVGPDDGLKAVTMGLAAELSAREKRTVGIDGLDFG
jgi:myo-inositol 2-dehydrogenase/D-chiro-inositol 1-dehydrogenase